MSVVANLQGFQLDPPQDTLMQSKMSAESGGELLPCPGSQWDHWARHPTPHGGASIDGRHQDQGELSLLHTIGTLLLDPLKCKAWQNGVPMQSSRT